MTYEILTIANSELPEKGQKDLSKKIQDLIKKEKGKTITEGNLGTKKLATPMKEQETGTYLSIMAELKPKSIKAIKKQISGNGDIINVFIFKSSEIIEEKPKNKVKPKSKKTTKKAKLKKKIKKVEKVTKASKVKKVVKTKKLALKTKKKSVKPEKKSEITAEIEGEEDRLKKLDDKLDEILKE